MAYVRAATFGEVNRYSGQSLLENNPQMTRRQLLELAGLSAATLARPLYLRNSVTNPKLETLMERPGTLDVIRRYNTQIAQEMLVSRGPEAVYKLGLERYLQGSRIEEGLIKAGVLSTSYSSSSPRIAEYLHEGLRKLIKASPLAAASLLEFCGDKGPGSPTVPGSPTQPSNPSATGIISGTAYTIDNTPVNGKIDFMQSEMGPILGTAAISGGNFRAEVKDPKNVKRYRIGDSGQPNFLTTEKNASRNFIEGDNPPVQYLVLDRKPGLIDFYDKINREAPVRVMGVKRVTDPLTYYADMRTKVGDARQTPSQRVQETQAALDGIYKSITGWSAPAIIKAGDNIPPEGNGNVIIVYGQNNYGGGHFSGNRIDGGHVGLPGANDPGKRDVDIAEIATQLFFLGESPDMPSIANDPSPGVLLGVDWNLLAAGYFESLAARKFTSLDGIVIESWEPPV